MKTDPRPGPGLAFPPPPEDARAALEPHQHRITWDAPIHSVQDIQDRLWDVRSINVKPSRAGAIERLFDIYDYCAEKDISLLIGGTRCARGMP